MSQSDEILTGTIDDYLLSIADGIEKAQAVLSKVRVPGQPGTPPTSYIIPSLEFELRMHIELSSAPEPAAPGLTRFGAGKASALSKVMRLAAPQAGSASQGKSIGEATSVIKGSFVAVPTNGGKPQPTIQTRIEKISGRRIRVVVSVRGNTGESMPGVEVNFNLDREATAELNAQLAAPQEGTDMSTALGVTDASGSVSSELIIANQESKGVSLVVLVDVLGDSETVIYEVQ
ncbi:MAG: hypothetical protein H6981_10780 [Gammaproteobacteria bacterium]|nr:hypothetical protein [Gammaproteobacteria bacterium]MCP5137273.1 hypothetical protein [Gammaproteobacteria bacterium]